LPVYHRGVDTARLGEVQVENAAGERIRLGSYWKDADALLVFVRHFGCAGCSEHVTELSARLPELATLGLRVVIVGCGDKESIAGFVERHRLADHDVEVVTDATLEAQRLAGLVRSAWSAFGPRALWGFFGLLLRGYSHRAPDGDVYQQGGTLLVQKGGVVVFADRARALGDHAPLVDVVDVALALRAKGATLA
jgi:peroxiredoxin